MLIKKDKKILSALIKLYNKTDDRGYFLFFDESNDRIYLTSAQKEIENDSFIDCTPIHKQIGLTLQDLTEKGYIKSDNVYQNYFYLTNKGVNYKFFKLEEIKSFFFRSILTPIIVSIIVAIITSIITTQILNTVP